MNLSFSFTQVLGVRCICFTFYYFSEGCEEIRVLPTRSPANKCKFSFHTIKSRLLRGDKLISESATPDYVGLVVEVLSSVNIKGQCGQKDGLLFLTCSNIPVNFTADPAGNVNGSLLGYMRPCEYIFREEFPLTYF
ncbi:hypothetical protein AtEden1_Chr5g0105501 [Arabidopsis thaliana]